MKKVTLFLVALISLSGPELVAQTSFRPALQKGAVLAGGSFSFNLGNATYEYSSQSNKTKINGITFNPEVGVFAANGVALGLLVDFSSETEKFEQGNNSTKNTTTQYLAGPFVRVYVKSGFFMTGSYSLGKTIYENSYSGGSSTTKASTSKWKLGMGYAAFLNDHVALEPFIAYQGVSVNEDEDGSDFTYRTRELVIGLGLSIYLTRKADAPVN